MHPTELERLAVSTLVGVEFAILGPVEVRAGNATVEIRRGIPRRLLVALLMHAGRTITASALTELLWGDDLPQHPENALHVQMSYLRKVLTEPAHGAQPLVTRPGGYSLNIAPEQLDSWLFERRLREADAVSNRSTAAELATAAAILDEALALWRGEPLADVAGEPFALGEIARLEELRRAAVESRVDVLLALGRHRELVGELSRLLDVHPLQERFHQQLILALYRSGRQADALDAYDRARMVLLEEMGLDPGPALQTLQRAVLNQDPDLDWVAPPGSDIRAAPPGGQPGGGSEYATSLPSPVTALLGREMETGRIHDLLARFRLVTLTGPGGAGKSRLAVEVARTDAGGAEVWFVDLSAVSAPELVAPTVAAALGVPTPPDEDACDAVVRALSRRQGLLVLDTCEHVITGAADLVSRVLHHGPDVRVLATSRQPLRITGEIAWPVPPLALPPANARTAREMEPFPAIGLFIDRAARVRPDFELTDSNAADVAAICLALDGLPLAVELAAARADVLTPAAISARLQNRFELLVEGGRELAPRQQTLRAAIDWSFDLLDDGQRRFFKRLGVFAGSFDLEAAVTVAGHELPDPLGLLGALVRQSMVVVAGEDRYRLLDTVRAYANELLDQSGEAAETRHRSAGFYRSRAEVAEVQVRGPAQRPWLASLHADVANFRAALDWALATGDGPTAARLAGALAWFWTLSGMLDEAIQYHERALAMSGVSGLVRARVLWGFGLLVASLGQLERARIAGAESVALAREADDDQAIGLALNTLAVAQWALGEPEAAASHDEALRHFRVAGDLWGEAVCAVLRARTALDAGDPDAPSMTTAALAAARLCGDRHVVGIALEQTARANLILGDIDAAAAAALEALTAQESIGYTEGMVAALHLLGTSRAAAGRFADARGLHLRALELATRIGHAAATCEALEDVARVAAAEASHAQALRLLGVARRERRSRNLPQRVPDQRGLETIEGQARAALGGPLAAEAERAVKNLGLDDLIGELLGSGNDAVADPHLTVGPR
jgi:predicted ATPase/DNA-binding SARP family transcriptional activator